jgi:CheY-like chemotaxis protein
LARPTFLVIEPQPLEGISTRKLVLETALYNVLTAYSGGEGIELLDKFPDVDAVVVHMAIPDLACLEVIGAIKKRQPRLHVLALSPGINQECQGADRVLSSHDPQILLRELREIAGPPQ